DGNKTSALMCRTSRKAPPTVRRTVKRCRVLPRANDTLLGKPSKKDPLRNQRLCALAPDNVFGGAIHSARARSQIPHDGEEDGRFGQFGRSPITRLVEQLCRDGSLRQACELLLECPIRSCKRPSRPASIGAAGQLSSREMAPDRRPSPTVQ